MGVKFRKGFLESDEGLQIKKVLQGMILSDSYNTTSSYSTDTLKYPDNLRPFDDKHMDYLNSHPHLEPNQYILNIKLMSRV